MIKKAKREDYKIVAKLAKELWMEHSIEELEKEFWEYLTSKNVSIFIAYENQIPIAFVQVSLRYEYVEGTTTSPVAYLEGIFVKNDYRNQGIGTSIICDILKQYAVVYLWVYKKNYKAIRLYKRLGFEVSEETETRYLLKAENIL